MNRFCGDPNRLSLTSTPLIMNTLSNANAPLIDDLAGVRRDVRHARRELGDARERPRRGERLDLVVLEVRADDRRRDRRRRLAHDVGGLRHARRPHVTLCSTVNAQRHVVLPDTGETPVNSNVMS